MSIQLSEMKLNKGKLVRNGEFDVLVLSNSSFEGKGLSFLEDVRFLNETIENQSISCVICSSNFESLMLNHKEGVYVSNRPRFDYFCMHNYLCTTENYRLPNYPTRIGDNCTISNLAYIDEQNVSIGNNVIIEEFVSIQGHATIGDNVVICSGTMIGGRGFEYKRNNNEILHVTHAGSVVIEDNVEVLSGCTIHKAVYPWDKTLIGEYSKLNSQVHLDHSVKVGKSVLIGAGAKISGRANIGSYVWIGPNSVVANRIKIGEGAKVSLGSVVTREVNAGRRVTGNFAIDHEKWISHMKTFR